MKLRIKTILISIMLSFCSNLFAQQDRTPLITPRLSELLLDLDLLTPEKVSEINSIIKDQSPEVQKIYNEAGQNSLKTNAELIMDAGKKVTKDITATLNILSKNRTLDLKRATEFFVIGGSLESLFQYNKFLAPTKKTNYNWNFLPISRRGFEDLDPEGFAKYVRAVFTKKVAEGKNIVIIDTYLKGTTLKFVRDILSELTNQNEEKPLENEARIVIIGVVEYLRDLEDPANIHENYDRDLKAFYDSQSKELPILKIAGDASERHKLFLAPKSHPGKYDMISDDGRPRTDSNNLEPIKELKAYSRGKKNSKSLSRYLEVYLSRRFETVNFLKNYYSLRGDLAKACAGVF